METGDIHQPYRKHIVSKYFQEQEFPKKYHKKQQYAKINNKGPGQGTLAGHCQEFIFRLFTRKSHKKNSDDQQYRSNFVGNIVGCHDKKTFLVLRKKGWPQRVKIMAWERFEMKGYAEYKACKQEDPTWLFKFCR